MKRYIMVGAGGTASHLIHALVQYAPDAVIHIWDADKVEPANLERQLFYENEIGKSKATCFADRWPNRIVAHLDFVGEDNIEEVIEEDDTVLICADNMAIRRVINRHARRMRNIKVINGGNEKHSGSVQVFHRANGINQTPSLDFHSPEFNPENDEVDRSKLSCAQIAVLPGGEQTIIANQTVAAMMMSALWRLDSDIYQREKQWTKLTFDHELGEFQASDVRRLRGALDAH